LYERMQTVLSAMILKHAIVLLPLWTLLFQPCLLLIRPKLRSPVEKTPGYTEIVDGLIAYYPFNGNANDESGNGNHGIVYGATPAMDRFGNTNSAYYFDGEDDYIIRRSANAIPTSGPQTFSAWLKYDRDDPGFSNPEVLSIGNASNFCSDGGLHGIIILGQLGARTSSTQIGIRRGCDLPGFGNSISDEEVGNSQWHHIVTGYDGSKSFTYIDGILKTSALGTDYIHNSSTIWIGGRREGDTTHVKGFIDDVRIYNRALSETEIQTLYNNKTK
jgi:hypothetical protein